MTPRVVIDTNVLVSSFFDGPPQVIIDYWRDGNLTLCLSPSIVDEYQRILERLKLPRNEVVELFDRFACGNDCLFTASTPSLAVVERDPDDDKFIECAIALDARIVITGDQDLLSLERYFQVEMLSPRMFLDAFSPQSNRSI